MLMANVAETRVKISLTDAMSGGLRNIKGNLDAANSSAVTLKSTFSSMVSAGAGIAAGMAGFDSIGNKLTEIIGKAVDYNKTIETNSIGMAGILTSMTQIGGKQLEWNQALSISQNIMKSLNQDALRTAATSEELINTFRALLAPGLGAGMDISQIQKLTTVGTNAVKSLGLTGPQIIQELRDLVQGGIRPASSTLATSLGITDADIKAAKTSSEGLFKFLMDRMKGFDQASNETAKTFAGLTDQAKTGLTMALGNELKPFMDEYKSIMGGLSAQIINPQTNEISQELSESLRIGAAHTMNMYGDLKDVAGIIVDTVAPGAKLAASALGFAADNTKAIALGVAAWKIGNKVSEVQNAMLTWTSYGQKVQQAAQLEMQAANQAASVVSRAETRKQQALRESKVVQQGFSKLISQNQGALAIELKLAAQYYERLGLSAEQAGRLQYQAAKQAARGHAELTQQILTLQEQHILASKAAEKHAALLGKAQTAAGMLGGAAAALGLVLQGVASDTDSWAYSTGNYLVQAGLAVEGIAMLLPYLDKLVAGYKAVAAAKATAGMTAAVAGAGALAIGAGVGALAAGAYAYMNDLSADDIYERYFGTKKPDNTADFKKLNDTSTSSSNLNPNSLEVNDFGGKTDAAAEKKAAAAAKKAETAAKRAEQRLQKQMTSISKLQADLNQKILEATGEAAEISQGKLTQEISKMQAKLQEAKVAGVSNEEIAKTEELISKYKDLQTQLANNDAVMQAHDQRMSLIQAWQDAEIIGNQRADELRREELTGYQEHLREMLATQQLNTEQRLQIMQELADAHVAIESTLASDMQHAWDTALDYIRNKTFDQQATIRSGIDEILGEFTNFGQNMLTESKSISERFDDLFKSLANSIINTMMKVIMQGLIMKSIMGIFGMGGGGASADASYFSSYKNSSYLNDPNWIEWTPKYADGGVASGWSIVGEQGPELVNFGQPGRVYTAEQTAAALGAAGRNGVERVNVVIENRSGQQMKAVQSTSQINGKEMIINIIMDAIATNENGINNILKGAVANA